MFCRGYNVSPTQWSWSCSDPLTAPWPGVSSRPSGPWASSSSPSLQSMSRTGGSSNWPSMYQPWRQYFISGKVTIILLQLIILWEHLFTFFDYLPRHRKFYGWQKPWIVFNDQWMFQDCPGVSAMAPVQGQVQSGPLSGQEDHLEQQPESGMKTPLATLTNIGINCFLSPTPTIIAFTGFTNAHGPSPQLTECRSP